MFPVTRWATPLRALRVVTLQFKRIQAHFQLGYRFDLWGEGGCAPSGSTSFAVQLEGADQVFAF